LHCSPGIKNAPITVVIYQLALSGLLKDAKSQSLVEYLHLLEDTIPKKVQSNFSRQKVIITTKDSSY
jgi:hypothetical protein